MKQWQKDFKYLETIFAEYGFEIRLVGGAVRDLLMGFEPKDFDFATDALPLQMIPLLTAHGNATYQTGIKHGTITAIIEGRSYEITTLRADVDCDGRHAEVEFIKDFEQDMFRRDFTINALMCKSDMKIIDCVDGLIDIDNSYVRFVGDAGERITEDYLRILRYFRFVGRIGISCEWDEDTLQSIRKHASSLWNISGERIWDEMKKIMVVPHALKVLRKMGNFELASRCGARQWNTPLSVILEERVTTLLDLQIDKIFKWTNDPLVRFSLLVSDIDHLNELANWYGMSNDEQAFLEFMITNRYSEDGYKKLAVDHGKENALKLLEYQGRHLEYKDLDEWDVVAFPVRGQDLINKGMKPGKVMGAVLKVLEEQWASSGYTDTKKQLLTKVF